MKKIIILHGGWSHETPHVITYGRIENALKELGTETKLVSVNDDDFIAQIQVFNPDSVFITNQGAYGEDGKIQGLLNLLDIKYTGSGSYACSIGMNKYYSKLVFQSLGIKTPDFKFYLKTDAVPEFSKLSEEFGLPFILKPNLTGCSFGISLISDEEEYNASVKDVIEKYGDYLIEEFIDGNKVEYSTGVLESTDKVYELPICQSNLESVLFSVDTKFNDKNSKVIDPDLSEELKSKMVEIAKKVHFRIGCSGYSRTDFILRGNDIYALEYNTCPGMMENSIFPQLCLHIGISYKEMIEIIVNNSLTDKVFEIEKIHV